MRFPAISVVDHHAVSTFAASNFVGLRVGILDVIHAVANPFYTACSTCQNTDVARHIAATGQGEIGALVPVVAEGRAREIRRLGRRIAVDILLNITVSGQIAVNGR